ncbi:hypothetical protein [Streptomyces sp. HNM0574]|uniref:hypothetical protein n=1 Tax=Streptomyces sp. HNM0574 TaxID=2714954 RepID=UPI00146E960A|nr:hypothetical protein [Streptomyces sp. HNM0574]NLU66766.1 hypothetical protein [Streptomyces sp. HNM0574]
MTETTRVNIEGKQELLRSLLDHHLTQGQNVLSGGARHPYPRREELGEWKPGALPEDAKRALKEFVDFHSSGLRELRDDIERVERGHKGGELADDEAVAQLNDARLRLGEMHADSYARLAEGLSGSLSGEDHYNIFDDAISAIGNAANAVGDAATSAVQGVKHFFDTVPGQIVQKGVEGWNAFSGSFNDWIALVKINMSAAQIAELEEALAEMESAA